MSSRSGVATLRTAIHLLLTYLCPYEHAVDWVKIKRGVKSRRWMVAETRENTATINNKQANKKQLNYTCTWNSIDFLSNFFRKLALGPCNLRILLVIGWAQIAISQSHDACAPSLRGHAPMDHNSYIPLHGHGHAPDRGKVRARCRVRAKFHYTGPTGPARTQRSFAAKKVRAGPVGSVSGPCPCPCSGI